jgi:thiamine-monophosphate kinase
MPGDLALDWVDGFMAGLREECGEVGAAIVGGDVTAADVITLGITALGDLQGRDPVTLDGAKPGDVVAVCGKVGWAAAGFAVLGRGFRSPVQVVTAHRRPEPPYAEGPRAAQLGATAMTDISDGLVADLGHIAEASGVRIDLRADLLAVPAKLREVGAALNVDPQVWLFTGGDDYALAASFPKKTVLPDAWTVIGAVTDGEGVRVDGRRWPAGGHEHFR